MLDGFVTSRFDISILEVLAFTLTPLISNSIDSHKITVWQVEFKMAPNEKYLVSTTIYNNTMLTDGKKVVVYELI